MTNMTRHDYTSTSRIAPRASCEIDDVSDCRLSRPTGRFLEGSGQVPRRSATAACLGRATGCRRAARPPAGQGKWKGKGR